MEAQPRDADCTQPAERSQASCARRPQQRSVPGRNPGSSVAHHGLLRGARGPRKLPDRSRSPQGRGREDTLIRLRARSTMTISAIGLTQTLAWGSSYYLPAILADPIAAGLGV